MLKFVKILIFLGLFTGFNCARTTNRQRPDLTPQLKLYLSSLYDYMMSLDCPKGNCDYLHWGGKYIKAMNNLSDVMLDLKRIGSGPVLRNTDENFEIVLYAMAKILDMDNSVNYDLLANALMRASRLRKQRQERARYRSMADSGIGFDYADDDSESPEEFKSNYTIDAQVEEDNFGSELKEVGKFAEGVVSNVLNFTSGVIKEGMAQVDRELNNFLTEKNPGHQNNVVSRQMSEGYNSQKSCTGTDKLCNYIDFLEKYTNNLMDGKDKMRSQFGPKWMQTRDKVAATILNLRSSYNGTQVINPSLENFKEVCKGLFFLCASKHNRGRTELIKSAIFIASEARSDKNKLTIRIEDLFEEVKAAPLSVNFSVSVTMHAGGDYADDYNGEGPMTASWTSLGVSSRVPELESRIDYLREDNDIHTMHSSWHQMNGQRVPTNRKRERFFYFHNLMIQRYNTARMSDGVPLVVPMSISRQEEPFSVEYNISPENDPEGKLQEYSSTNGNCELRRINKFRLKEAHFRLMRFGKEGIESFGHHCEHYYHANLHNFIGNDCGIGMMAFFSVSARPPIFYRIHAEINRVWLAYYANRRYEKKDVFPPRGLTIRSVAIHSRCARRNQVETFWEKLGRNYKLNKQPFLFRVRLRNWRRLREKVIIRIFIGHQKARLEQHFEIDRFVHQLNGQMYVDIKRLDKDTSFVLLKDKNDCGWPFHLLLPKGGDKKPLKFRLLVFVNSVHDQSVNVGMSPELNSVMCGANKQNLAMEGLHMVDDVRDYGFPLNRRWDFNPSRVINNRDRMFGYMSSMVSIVHTGEETSSCRQEYFRR